MIFIQIKTEGTVQAGDKTRIDVEGTFISPDEAAITLIEIQPDASSSYVDVTSTKYLDWAYETEGTKAISVRVTTDGAPTTKADEIICLSESNDRLFSNDNDILSYEVDIYRLLRKGRSSFLDFHRIAQRIILDDLDQKGLTDNNGNRLTKLDVFDIEEVKEWSKYTTLSLIFKSVQSEIDDVYDQKSKMYSDMADRQKTRATIRLDLDNDGTVDTVPNLVSGIMVRR